MGNRVAGRRKAEDEPVWFPPKKRRKTVSENHSNFSKSISSSFSVFSPPTCIKKNIGLGDKLENSKFKLKEFEFENSNLKLKEVELLKMSKNVNNSNSNINGDTTVSGIITRAKAAQVAAAKAAAAAASNKNKNDNNNMDVINEIENECSMQLAAANAALATSRNVTSELENELEKELSLLLKAHEKRCKNISKELLEFVDELFRGNTEDGINNWCKNYLNVEDTTCNDELFVVIKERSLLLLAKEKVNDNIRKRKKLNDLNKNMGIKEVNELDCSGNVDVIRMLAAQQKAANENVCAHIYILALAHLPFERVQQI